MVIKVRDRKKYVHGRGIVVKKRGTSILTTILDIIPKFLPAVKSVADTSGIVVGAVKNIKNLVSDFKKEKPTISENTKKVLGKIEKESAQD